LVYNVDLTRYDDDFCVAVNGDCVTPGSCCWGRLPDGFGLGGQRYLGGYVLGKRRPQLVAILFTFPGDLNAALPRGDKAFAPFERSAVVGRDLQRGFQTDAEQFLGENAADAAADAVAQGDLGHGIFP